MFTGLQNTFAQKDPVVMEIDGKPVTKSEFLQIYLKNNPSPKFDQASLDEYVEMFTKFKLKVAEAEKLGFKRIMVSKYAIKGLDVDKYKIRVIAVSKLEEMYQRLVGNSN